VRIAIVNVTAGNFSGGYLKYLQQLLPLLRADRRVERLDVFVPPHTRTKLMLDSVPLRTWPEGDPLWGFRELRRQLRLSNPDVVFVPTARWVSCGRIPVVTMVRNMEPLEVPFAGNSLAAGLKNVARAFVARRACDRSTRVIAVSNHVRDFLVDRWRIDRTKIGVVSHGVERIAECGPSTVPSALAARESAPFIFTAGSIRPARGLEDIIEAFAAVREIRPRLALVIAGESDTDSRSYRHRLARRANELGVADRVVWAGSLSRPAMWWCFEACSAFVMTSRAEACPNTALEAMSRGCLCISVDHPPMPEFLGATALYYPAGDVARLTRRLSSVLTGDAESFSVLRAAAVRRAAEFDWGTTARRTISELQLASSEPAER